LKKLFIGLLVLSLSFLLTGCQSATTDGAFFHDYIVNPFVILIHAIGSFFNENYGLAIIIITLIVRLLLFPLMLSSYKKQQAMRIKMEKVKPEMEQLQKRLKEAKSSEEQRNLQQEMMLLYKKHDINPFAMGCLPMIIQIPIWMGLYYAINVSEDISTHSFLWFNLGEPNIIMAVLAGIAYFFQFKVSLIGIPPEQQGQMKFIGLLSPIFILVISFSTPAALPLYWTISGLFLIGQTYLLKKMYPMPNTASSKE